MISIEDFRTEVRAFLDARFNVRDPDEVDEREDVIARAPDGHERLVDAARSLQWALAAAGLSGVHLAPEYGGRGLTLGHSKVIDDELRRYDAPSLRPVGLGLKLVAPTLLSVGSEEQKRRFLPPLIRSDEQWCQLFSEPDAGSDLASLRTRAVLDGDQWVVDGQKVWSSYASHAHFGLLLARTDPTVSPHTGITMFVVSMNAPGVSVRPLVDIAGGHHFNEVFLEGVRLNRDAAVGDVGNGWAVSQGTLGGERSAYLGGSGGGRRQRQAIEAARTGGLLGDAVIRQRIAQIASAERILEWMRDRHAAGALADGTVGGSMLKLATGTLEQHAAELIADIAGARGQAWDRTNRDGDMVSHSLNASRQSRIAGGTHEIQRNLLGERVLRLPREAK